MKDRVKARITWLSDAPPNGVRRSPICRVIVGGKTLTLSLDFICAGVDENNRCDVDLSFLFSEFSAKDILKSGEVVDLYEGSKKVAEAAIL